MAIYPMSEDFVLIMLCNMLAKNTEFIEQEFVKIYWNRMTSTD